MYELCHRCHGELPAPSASPNGDDATLFCPRCGAPQIRLPEHMQTEISGPPAASTTGALPPPRPFGTARGDPNRIDWHAALTAAAAVAVVSAALLIASLKFSWLSLPGFIFTAGGAIIALGLYARWRPLARMDTGVGLRVGAVTGLLIIACMASGLALTGVVLRFETHGMDGFDTDAARLYDVWEVQMRTSMQQQHQPADVQEKLLSFVHSPEARTGLVLAGLALQAAIIFLLALGGGSFAGMMRTSRTPRARLPEGD